MKINVGFLCIAILIPARAFACDLSVLTDTIDRLKGSDSPLAGTIALDCAAILKTPDNTTSLANLTADYKDALSNDPDAASLIETCSPEEIRRAC